MKNHIKYAVLSALTLYSLSSHAQAEMTAKAEHLYSILYADLENQPILRVCVHSENGGEELSGLQFQLRGHGIGASLKSIDLFRSADGGSCKMFSTRTDRGTEKVSPMKWRLKRDKSTLSFTGKNVLKKGDNFFWLVANTRDKVPGNATVDAELTQVRVGDKKVKISDGDPQGEMELYPFYHRVSAYYRCEALMNWLPKQLTKQDFKLLTDVFYFNVRVDNAGNIQGGESPLFLQGLEKLKKLRGNEPVDIILGIAHCDDALTHTAGSGEARRNLARQLKEYLDKHDFDGVDIDWEYPDTEKQWTDFAYLVLDIRETFGANGKTISAAVNMGYKAPRKLLLDQLDYVNIMCYDRQGEHATMAHYEEDISRSRAVMPLQKIVMGLPFYSCDIPAPRDWNAQTGYAAILEKNPRLKASDNHATVKGEKHYFNGASLIAEKSKIAEQRKLGGVMIWAYEWDIDMKSPLSLRRAMFKEIRRKARPRLAPDKE